MYNDRVAVAMSGGVDSSVAAAFLKNKGYDVFGLTIKFWGKQNRCCSPDDIRDALHVAKYLDIPHYVINLEKPFRSNVVDYFISEYRAGRTPNPCAVCNPTIKFGELMQRAADLGAKFLATGHYAVISYDESKEMYLLKRAKERGKDQSYFLARLSQESLSRTFFPVGNFPKAKIRKLAERFNLHIAQKTESQEVCFIPDGNIIKFIENESGETAIKGPIVESSGKLVGTHRGITGYTIGQRKGLGIARGKPVYVTKIEAKTNTIFIGDPEELYHQTFFATDAYWTFLSRLTKPMRVKARIRYKHRPAWATIQPTGKNKIKVNFDRPQRAITPGQLSVFYDGDVVFGSGWIDEVVE